MRLCLADILRQSQAHQQLRAIGRWEKLTLHQQGSAPGQYQYRQGTTECLAPVLHHPVEQAGIMTVKETVLM